MARFGRLAQLARASGLHPEGHRFEPCTAHYEPARIAFCTKLSEQPTDTPKSTTERWIALLLRLLGISGLFAIPAAAMPDDWIMGIHKWLGLGEFPHQPIAFYLARSASAMYALHGALFVYMSFDVRRYLPVIRILAVCMSVMGVGIVAIDISSGLPAWWIWIEGPFLIVYGLLLICMSRRAAEENLPGG